MKIFDAVAWIIIANLALYIKTLRHKFVSDDFTVFQQTKTMPFKNPWHKAWMRFIGACKLMSPTVHFISGQSILDKGGLQNVIKSRSWYMVLTKSEEFEHLLALLIHIAICLAIFFAFGANTASFIAALFYGSNPVNNQGTIWPGGRGYALPILSLLLAIALPVLSPVLLYFCSWFTIGFLAPLALIGSTKWYLLALMPVIWWLHTRKYTTAIKLKHNTEAFEEDRKWHWRKIVVFFKTYGFYLALCIVPFRITFYHNQLQSMAGNDIMRRRAYSMDRYFWLGISAFLGTITISILHWGLVSWALLAYFITIAPFCNVVRANQEIAERFVSMPNVFLMYALAILASPHPVAVAVILCFYITRTFYTVNMYKDEYIITEMAVIEDPHAWWAWHCRAMKRWDTQSYKEALILWVMAKLISPKEFKILINIATCLRLLGNHKEADDYLTLAEQNIISGQEKEAREFIEQHRKGQLPILL